MMIDLGDLIPEGTKNRDIRRISMTWKLTGALENAKKINCSGCAFSDNGRPCGNVKTVWWND
jgi:hypothetical protein